MSKTGREKIFEELHLMDDWELAKVLKESCVALPISERHCDMTDNYACTSCIVCNLRSEAEP